MLSLEDDTQQAQPTASHQEQTQQTDDGNLKWFIKTYNYSVVGLDHPNPPGEVLPYMSYILLGMCCCEGYGFQRIYSRIGYRNQRVLV